MKLDDEKLSALYRQATERRSRRAGTCPSPEAIAGALDEKSSRLEREAILEHLSGCSDCAAEVRSALPLAAMVAEELGRPAAAAAAASRPSSWVGLSFLRSWRLLASAAALTATLGLSVVLWRDRGVAPESEEVYRGAQPALASVVPAEGATLTEPPHTLSWSPAQPADRYRVVLFDFESTPIWESPLVATATVVLPEDVRGRLGGGRPCYWRVVLLAGANETESELYRFSVAAPRSPARQ